MTITDGGIIAGALFLVGFTWRYFLVERRRYRKLLTDALKKIEKLTRSEAECQGELAAIKHHLGLPVEEERNGD